MPAPLRPLLLLALLAGLAAAPATAQPAPDQGRVCSAPTPTDAEAAAAAAAVRQWLATHDYEAERGGTVTIPIAFHVVMGGSAVSQGNIPDRWIEDQVDVLNEAYAELGYRFILASVDRTLNPDWYFGLDLGTPAETQMKQALALDPARFLNIYTARLAGGTLGWAYFPPNYPENSPIHGVVLLDQSLPGGSAAPYNLGDTGTHEVGHYMGLYHTFQGGCTGAGDSVDDTPAEASPAFGCPVGRDSCPAQPGLDPIRNFMDYTDDACMDEFTPGQAERAFALMSQYRPTMMAGAAAFASPGTLAFSDLYVGATETQAVTLVNLTAEDLEITGIESSSDAFTVEVASLTVPAEGTAQLEVTFAPQDQNPYMGTLTLTTDNEEVGEITVQLVGNGLLAPALGIELPAVLAEAEEGAEATASVTLTNAGPGTLIYSFAAGDRAAPRDEGGPDAFGYSWIDSNEPGGPAYAWEDISGTGTALSLSASATTVPLPFSFPFYGETYTAVNIATANGFLNFGATATSFTNAPIPDPAEPNNLVAPFWDGLDPNGGGTVYYRNMEDGRFIVQWDGVRRFGQASSSLTFQAILYSNGAIRFQYEDLTGTLTSATVGIENANGSVGLEVVYNAAYLEEGLAVLFRTEPDWPEWIASIDPDTGAIEPGGQQEVTLTLDASELEAGVYQQLLGLLTNDPLFPTYRIHVVFGVGGVLPPPALVGPAYGETDVPVDLVLTWTPVPDADAYDVEIATDEDFEDVAFSGTFDATTGVFVADAGATFFWRVRSVAGAEASEWSLPFVFTTGTATAADPDRAEAGGFALGAAFPNPTRGDVSVALTLDEARTVSLRVYDVRGRLMATVAEDAAYPAGTHTVRWDARALPAGVYLLRLVAGERSAAQRVVVLR